MSIDRRALQRALLDAAPWLSDDEAGPRNVDAGNCDRCGRLPRLLPTCGPAAPAGVCRDCAEQLGDDAWCDGHRDEGRAMRAWARALPERWPEAVLLWWVSTGELRLDDELTAAGAHWPAPVRRALGT